MLGIKDVYYSEQAFKEFTPIDKFYNVAEIDGKKVPYTEIITVGMKPLSIWEDLVYLGQSDKFEHIKLK